MPLPDKQVRFLENNCTDKESVDKTIEVLRQGNRIKFRNQKRAPEKISQIINRTFNHPGH